MDVKVFVMNRKPLRVWFIVWLSNLLLKGSPYGAKFGLWVVFYEKGAPTGHSCQAINVVMPFPLIGFSLKNNPAQLSLVEHPIGHLQNVVSRNCLHFADNVVHVFDGLAHEQRAGDAQKLVHAAFVA